MSTQRILVLALLFLTALTVTLLLTQTDSESPEPDLDSEPEVSAPQAPPPPSGTTAAPGAPVNPLPAPQAGLPPAQAPIAPPPETLIEEDDEQIEKEQVAAALAQLSNADPAQRIEGAEQLGAYPTKEAEAALQQVLATDADADVRNAAAQSLGYVEKPTDATVTALFSALEDQSEDVRLSALSTLEDFMLGADENSKRYKKILSGLQGKVDSRSIPQETRDAIRDIVNDQTAPADGAQ